MKFWCWKIYPHSYTTLENPESCRKPPAPTASAPCNPAYFRALQLLIRANQGFLRPQCSIMAAEQPVDGEREIGGPPAEGTRRTATRRYRSPPPPPRGAETINSESEPDMPGESGGEAKRGRSEVAPKVGFSSPSRPSSDFHGARKSPRFHYDADSDEESDFRDSAPRDSAPTGPRGLGIRSHSTRRTPTFPRTTLRPSRSSSHDQPSPPFPGTGHDRDEPFPGLPPSPGGWANQQGVARHHPVETFQTHQGSPVAGWPPDTAWTRLETGPRSGLGRQPGWPVQLHRTIQLKRDHSGITDLLAEPSASSPGSRTDVVGVGSSESSLAWRKAHAKFRDGSSSTLVLVKDLDHYVDDGGASQITLRCHNGTMTEGEGCEVAWL
jgi:hypothetical protein